jgi:hypothetical protein
MRKVALFAAVALAAAFANTSPSRAADDVASLNKNTQLFLTDVFNPYAASSKVAAAPAKKGKKGKKKA